MQVVWKKSVAVNFDPKVIFYCRYKVRETKVTEGYNRPPCTDNYLGIIEQNFKYLIESYYEWTYAWPPIIRLREYTR